MVPLTMKSLSTVKWELIKPTGRRSTSLVTETVMFLWMFIRTFIKILNSLYKHKNSLYKHVQWTCLYKLCSWKVTFLVTSKPPPTVSTYRHPTGFIVKKKHVHMPNYLGLPLVGKLLFLKFILLKKICAFQKFHKIYYSFFLIKLIIGYTCIFTK